MTFTREPGEPKLIDWTVPRRDGTMALPLRFFIIRNTHRDKLPSADNTRQQM